MKRKNSSKAHKEKFLSMFSGLSGSLSFLGGWQVCHNLCLGIIALLSVVGIAVVGMPFLFLTQYAVYFWSLAALLLVPTLILYWKNRKCISANLILFNIGIVIASVPFAQLQAYQVAFWLVGGVLIASSVWMFVKPKFQKNNKNLASGAISAP
ncbi:MAG: hypothetical protein HYW26_04085 [Candidatus Aenigmarchaeota archaeon]|nr:hypothetical protein [Candidatus Aenigmarchaeota archaeon]